MGVKIEIFRMVLYLTFPVTVFWISNQAEYFEEYVVKRKKEIFPLNDAELRKELEDFKEEIRARREERLSQKMAMESENSRRK
ncbi:protein PET100 homolog, mitochondrial [Cynoglossus semilaevis]|uniref:protein PET100 homolog, mitochondrial n=1 Tax=Cynoglossus semilaevis TaxID=244447 RepID=UPI000496CE84|nr:protein PET100 homolog, mitochondrial [Cynoglossus semilaevis]